MDCWYFWKPKNFLIQDKTIIDCKRTKSERYLYLSNEDPDDSKEFWCSFRELKKFCKIRHAWARTIHTFQVGSFGVRKHKLLSQLINFMLFQISLNSLRAYMIKWYYILAPFYSATCKLIYVHSFSQFVSLMCRNAQLVCSNRYPWAEIVCKFCRY